MIENMTIDIYSDGNDMEKVLDTVEGFAENANLATAHTTRIRLLTEETMSMIRQITGNPKMHVSFISEEDCCTIRVETDTRVNYYVRSKLLSISKSGRNEAARGFLGKIRDMMEHFICLTSPDLSDLPSDAEDPVFMIGMMPGDLISGVDLNSRGMVYWSLKNYKDKLNEEEDEEGGKPDGEDAEGTNEGGKADNLDSNAVSKAWDELERSVVANLADDIRIGIKGEDVFVDVMIYL